MYIISNILNGQNRSPFENNFWNECNRRLQSFFVYFCHCIILLIITGLWIIIFTISLILWRTVWGTKKCLPLKQNLHWQLKYFRHSTNVRPRPGRSNLKSNNFPIILLLFKIDFLWVSIHVTFKYLEYFRSVQSKCSARLTTEISHPVCRSFF